MLTRILALVAVLLLAPSTLAHAHARTLSLESASLGIFARNVDLLKEIPDLTHCCTKEKSTEQSESSNRREEYLRARYMDPSQGRFAGMDQWGGSSHDPRSLHKYAYAHLNPTFFVDPSGYESLPGLLSALNSFISLRLTAIRIAGQIGSARLKGIMMNRLGKGVEMYVRRLIEMIAQRTGGGVANVAVNYPIKMFGKRSLIDFVIRLQGRVAYLEVKYGIPQVLGPAFTRLEQQLSLSLIEASLAGEGEVILFAAAERAAAERLLVGALGEEAGAVEIANGMIELFNILRGIFWI